MKKLVVFDMDGTILNTLDDLKDTLNYALGQYHFPARTLEETRAFVGNGIHKLIERAVPEGTDAQTVEKVFNTFLEYYQIHCMDQTRPYPGIVSLLQSLKEAGLLTAVVSNKADAAVQELCERFFPGLFDFAVGEHEGVQKKPAPDMVQLALRTLGTQASDAVYVGDSDVDLATAKNSGLDGIIVTWGFRDREFLESQGVDVFADTPEKVRELCLS